MDRRGDGLGIVLGRLFPDLDSWVSKVKVAGMSLPIAVGLLVMMYPVLAKVRYGELGRVTSNRRLMVPSLVLNWVIGPAVMFALAWLMLPDLPAYRTGLIIVGLARCIAMVLIWNDLAGGDREAAAVLVALNSLFQIVAFAGLAYFYLRLLPGWLGLSTATCAGVDLGHRQERADLLGYPPGRRLGVADARGALAGPGLVRAAVHPEGGAGRPVRAAVHHRGALRPPRRRHQPPPRRCGPHRRCRCWRTSG